MKRFYCFISFLTLIFVSCSRYTSVANQPNWKNQLEKLIIETQTDSLVLEAYSYRARISSEEDFDRLIKELFNEKAVVAFGTIERPFITTMGEVLVRQEGEEASFKLEEYLRKGTGIVDTRWRCGDKTYNTAAVVSDEGVIYDNIGWYLIKHGNTNTKAENDSTNTYSGSVDFSLSDEGTNSFGMTLYRYVIWCTSVFGEDGVLISKDLSASSEQHFGWYCDASIVSVAGEPFVSLYHTFSWAYAYNFGSSVSISYNGVGFSFHGSGHKASGTETHIAPPADSLAIED
jgi:hypothetical protein